MIPLWIVEAAVLAAAVLHGARIAAKPSLRRALRANLRWALVLLVVAVAIGIPLLWAASRWPPIRHTLVIGLAVGMAAAWWRARPEYGRRRRFPPGSLGIGQSLDALRDRRFYLDQAQRYGPVFKMSQFGRPTVCVVGFGRARAVLGTHGSSLAGAPLPYNRVIPRGVLRYMPSPDHKAVAPLFRTTFSGLALGRSEGVVRACYRRGLARMAEDSSRGPEGVRGRLYFERPVLEALGDIFLGLGPNDPRLDELSRSLASLAFHDLPLGNWRKKVMAGLTRTIGILREVEADWGGADGDGAPSALRALVTTVPNALDDLTLAGNFAVILRISLGDLVAFHDWVFKLLSDHPSALVPVRADDGGAGSGSGSPPSPATRIVMETLRLEQAEYLYRTATQPIEFEGVVIPAGWLVRLCIQESHRDPAVFPDPDRFDPERFALRAYSRTEYSPFGADAHGCMGSQLAFFLGAIFVEELARGFDWRVVSDGPVDRSWRHSSHWKPSEDFRVIMTPRR